VRLRICAKTEAQITLLFDYNYSNNKSLARRRINMNYKIYKRISIIIGSILGLLIGAWMYESKMILYGFLVLLFIFINDLISFNQGRYYEIDHLTNRST